ncbi:MAG: twin-arginine translocase TatA/TatE family subunit [Acidobacteriaceae bacterium]
MHFADSIVIFLLALILFGPKKLPEIARQVGKLMVEFRRASNEFKSQIDEELRAMEQQDRQQKMGAAYQEAPALAAPDDAPAVEYERDRSYTDDSLTEDALTDGADGTLTDGSLTAASRMEDYAGGTIEEVAEPVILPPSTGEPVRADSPYLPVPPPELLEAATAQPHHLYAEALAAEQNGSSNHIGPEPESAQAIVNHG